ncbi:DUF2779 domain-containing protein [Luteolibacter sp. GHJ8]|uniref:DUF2779 domain-containing protein n=1 Tax=Luteolibacter rhizosphaerae TaxID=2989719 RepID=A0ABT3G1C8_9BACT|nr:DUF2779 domain-containing protein [Luteolibacter rhizosphaerae]MCW1913040.1 DUF2779 domain-containing protein [Luteolibacter rhizosphaerae]
MYLTKSDFNVARECPTKLYYKKLRYPSLLNENPFMEFLADGGYMVEKMAKLLFPDGREMECSGANPEEAFSAAKRILEEAENVVLFEPTILAGRLSARIDILEKRGNVVRLIEVKSTSVDTAADGPNPFRGSQGRIKADKRSYLEDVTFQVMVFQRAFPDWQISPVLCVVDKARLATENSTTDKFHLEKQGGSRMASDVVYTGIPEALGSEHVLALVDVATEVGQLLPEITTAADELASSVDSEAPVRIAPLLRKGCKDCEYRVARSEQRNGFRECWGPLAEVEPHVLDFYRLGNLRPPAGADPVTFLVNQGKAGLLDIPESWLSGSYAPRQKIQLEHTDPPQEYLNAQIREVLRSHQYPLHFIDFEASRAALPYHEGMHPYQQAAFQWSCHTIAEPGGEVIHTEWINVEQAFSNFQFARSLRDVIGTSGTVYVWSSFEQTALRDIREHLDAMGEDDPDLAQWLRDLGDRDNPRVVDMEKLTKDYHFHPRMGGRTSIKVVLPAVWENNSALWEHPLFAKYFRQDKNGKPIDPYKTLEAFSDSDSGEDFDLVQEGTAAVRAYQDLVFGRGAENDDARNALKQQLLQYCELDTAAMVMIWMHWTGSAQGGC